MEEGILKDIVKDLKDSFKDKGKFVKLSNEDYESVEISEDNFHGINESGSDSRIVFIDGGNAEILKAANFSLQFARIYYTIYKDNKRVENKKYEFYVLIKSFDKEGKIFYKTKLFGDKIIDDFEFDSFDKSIIQGNNRADISFIGNVLRRFAELKIASKLLNSLDEKDIVIFDGSLETKYNGEKEILEEIYDKAVEKGVVISALSKTCELFTDKGSSVLSVLDEIQPQKEWYYHPIAKMGSMKHDILFVKLNEKSKYIFRFDILGSQLDKISGVLDLLKLNSKDPVFFGYPYGLIEADRFARVSNQELELLKTKFMIKAGEDWKIINSFLKTKDSHNILDNIR